MPTKPAFTPFNHILWIDIFNGLLKWNTPEASRIGGELLDSVHAVFMYKVIKDIKKARIVL